MPRHIRLKKRGITTVQYVVAGVVVVALLLAAAVVAFNGDSASKHSSTPGGLINETAKCMVVGDGPCKLDPSINAVLYYTYAPSFNLSIVDTSGHLLVLKQRGTVAHRFCYHPESLSLLEPCPRGWPEVLADESSDPLSWLIEPLGELTRSID